MFYVAASWTKSKKSNIAHGCVNKHNYWKNHNTQIKKRTMCFWCSCIEGRTMRFWCSGLVGRTMSFWCSCLEGRTMCFLCSCLDGRTMCFWCSCLDGRTMCFWYSCLEGRALRNKEPWQNEQSRGFKRCRVLCRKWCNGAVLCIVATVHSE